MCWPSVTDSGVGALGYEFHSSPRWTLAIRSFPLLVLLSILWTMWEPTWARLRRDEFQGRKSTVEGKGMHRVRRLHLLPRATCS